MTVVEVGGDLPDFALPDLRGVVWGKADLLGRSTVLFFFSSW